MKRVAGVINAENLHIARSILKIEPETLNNTKSLLIQKFNDVNAFYKHLTGLDELEYYQDRVIELQSTLTEAQFKRRELSYLLNDIRNKGIDIQDKLHKVKRHEEPSLFLELMREETDFIKKEREIFATLSEQERFERDVFTAFTNAIRDSQEKQRNRLEYAKYIGFGLTLIGALGSYVVTTWRTQDLKAVIRDTIRADVKQVFAESAQGNLQLMSDMNRQQMDSHAKILVDLRAEMSSVLDGLQADIVHMQQQESPSQSQSLHIPAVPGVVASSEAEWRILKWLGLGSAVLLMISFISR